MKKVKVTLLALTTLLALSGCNTSTEEVNYDAFAQCLTEEGMTMYGAFWCPHCLEQKELLGDSFEFIDYVECDPRDPAQEAERCLAENIESYPTWTYPDGRRWEGTQTLETLSSVTGCALPGAEAASDTTDETEASDDTVNETDEAVAE